jgi:hypothetical protein
MKIEADMTWTSIIIDYEKSTEDETIVADWRLIRRQTKLEVSAN